jgi:nicotinamide-nucleotide adenylyltransferase
MNGFLIGRFQPFHLGHLEAVNFALNKVENLWIGIGSSNKYNEKKNPFSADERRKMITLSVDDSIITRIKIFDIPDVGDHEKWTYSIDSIVPEYNLVFSNDKFTEDLYKRRNIDVVKVPLKDRQKFSGTNIRQLISDGKKWQDLVPEGTSKILNGINVHERLKDL